MLSKLLIIATAIILLASTQVQADEWTRNDTYWQVAVTALIIGDWGQTRYIAQNPDRYQEYNPILGSHPSTGSVDLYFATSIVAHAAIAYFLPSKVKVFGTDINPRRIWQLATIGLEIGCVGNNARLGIGFSF